MLVLTQLVCGRPKTARLPRLAGDVTKLNRLLIEVPRKNNEERVNYREGKLYSIYFLNTLFAAFIFQWLDVVFTSDS
jgi:hypothetical protein